VNHVIDMTLASLGIDRYFDFVFTSEALKHEKPDPRAFLKVAALAGVQPVHVLHVGDDLTRDYKGAKAVGMRSLWLQRHATKGNDKVPSQDIILQLPEIQRHL
jgi:FMN phosphatase YigB (HAD superfamily)